MSWGFKKVGKLQEELKAAVQSESQCPQAIRDELCLRIDQSFIHLQPGQAVMAESYGHMGDTVRPYNGTDTLLVRVHTVPLIDTPMEAQS